MYYYIISIEKKFINILFHINCLYFVFILTNFIWSVNDIRVCSVVYYSDISINWSESRMISKYKLISSLFSERPIFSRSRETSKVDGKILES